MAIYRQIYLTFWTDQKIQNDFTPEDKYFYLYLLTNPATNLCGCYEFSMKQAITDTGYSADTIENLLVRLEKNHKVIKRDIETNEVLLLNWHKYNWSTSKKFLAGVQKIISYIKSPILQADVTEILSTKYL